MLVLGSLFLLILAGCGSKEAPAPATGSAPIASTTSVARVTFTPGTYRRSDADPNTKDCGKVVASVLFFVQQGKTHEAVGLTVFNPEDAKYLTKEGLGFPWDAGVKEIREVRIKTITRIDSTIPTDPKEFAKSAIEEATYRITYSVISTDGREVKYPGLGIWVVPYQSRCLWQASD